MEVPLKGRETSQTKHGKPSDHNAVLTPVKERRRTVGRVAAWF